MQKQIKEIRNFSISTFYIQKKRNFSFKNQGFNSQEKGRITLL